MQPSARPTLNYLVEKNLSGLIRAAISVQRHSKRARLDDSSSSSNNNDAPPSVRRRLHAADINMALQLSGSEKLYATAVVSTDQNSNKKRVNLADFLRSSVEHFPVAPTEVGYHQHWLAVSGVQPDVAQNPSTDSPDKSTDQDSLLQVNQLEVSLLSEELQLYFVRVTLTMELSAATANEREQQDAVLKSVRQDSGLQELVPFLVRYCQQELYQHVTNVERCRTLVRLAASMLRNPTMHLELHLHELLPALTTCVVAQQLGSRGSNHWALRREAAAVLIAACNTFGDEYTTLSARLLQSLCDAVAPDQVLSSRYGGMVAVSTFGPRAVDAFLLPTILADWKEWETALQAAETSISAADKMEICMCQQASLNALGIFLQQVSVAEKAARLEWDDLEELFGDRLVVLQAEADDYAMCFV